jgi:VWFA-related protein
VADASFRTMGRNDFEVFEDGKLQPISNFYEVENSQPRSEGQPAAAGDAVPAPARFRRKVLVLIDNMNTTMHGRNEALDKLESFVNEHFDDGRYDWSIATVDRRVHMVLPLTSDKKVLHDVLAGIRHSATRNQLKAPVARSGPAIGAAINANSTLDDDPAGSRIRQQSAETVSAIANFQESANLMEGTMLASESAKGLAEAIRALGTSEGKKIILLVTGYMSPMNGASPLTRVGERDHLGSHVQDISQAAGAQVSLRDSLIREANASNTSFYIVSSEGLEVPDLTLEDAGMKPGSNARDTSSMYWLANETGGAYMPGNRIDQSFVEFDRRASSFYSLGYSPRHQDDNRYHRIKVRIKGRNDYELHYRDGYSSAPIDLQMSRSLRSSIGASLQTSTIPVSLIVGKPTYRGSRARVPIIATMSMESLQYITDARGSRTRVHVYVSIFDSDGRNITLEKSFADVSVQPNEQATGPMTITVPPVALAKGSYRVVLAVRDELTDHVGVISQRIDL